MAVTSQDIVNEARAWIGTPFHHQARAKGHGVDCIGLVVGVGHALGFSIEDKTNYARFPDGVTLAAELARQFYPVPDEDLQAGDILLFALSKLPRHVALYVGGGRMVHATSLVSRCVEVDYDKSWQRALRGVFRYREVT